MPAPREEAHWWDADPAQRDRNLRVEESLEDLIATEEQQARERRPMLNGHTSLIRSIGLIGFPAASAGFLIFLLATEFPKLREQNDTIIAEQRRAADRDAQMIELMQTLVRVTQRACSNAAKDDNARQRCFDR